MPKHEVAEARLCWQPWADGCACGDRIVGVEAEARFLAHVVFEELHEHFACLAWEVLLR